MLAEASLKDLLSNQEYSRTEKLLLCLAVDDASPKSVAQVRTLAVDAGLTEAKKWNVSDILSRAKGSVIKTKDGWELNSEGRHAVGELAGTFVGSVAPRVAAGLRHHLPKIGSAAARDFVEESVKAFEFRLFRAAVVLSWVGAVAVLHEHVFQNQLSTFNAEAFRRSQKWKTAKSTDDLGRMTEYEFLQVLESISLIGKNVKTELEGALKLRNGCGHPNSLALGEAKVAAHLETLLLNVFARF